MGRFMVGRYGYDELSKTLSIASIVCVVLSIVFRPFYYVALALLIWSVFRTCSRNIVKRGAEREKYLQLTATLQKKTRLVKRMWAERRTHRYFKCKNCGAVIRVPKGGGEVRVGCPRCRTYTKRKT